MEQNNKKKGNILTEIFDTFFILIICFGTLFSAMMIKGDAQSSMKYILNYTTFFVTITGLLLYLFFVFQQSDKGLKDMIEKLYGKQV